MGRSARAEIEGMSNLDPYRPPAAPIDALPPTEPVANCPKCGQRCDEGRLQLVGRRARDEALSRRQVQHCKAQYNGRTGAKLTGVIIGYQTVVLVVLLGAWLALHR